MKTKTKLIILSALAGIIFLCALAAPYIVPYDPDKQELINSLLPPCREHLLGTDRYGRDMLSRVIMGSRASIFSSLSLVLIITLTGSSIGILCGYLGGRIDSVIMRISDIFLAFPGMVFAIAAASVLGGGIINAVLALAAISWPKYARLARGQVLTIRRSAYIKAAVLNRTSTLNIILRHIIPNILGTILVTAVLDIGTMMMEIAGLSFLGLGAMPPTAEWGAMMSSGRSMIQTSPWVILSPGFAIFITVTIFSLLGDTLRDYIDPSRRKEQV